MYILLDADQDLALAEHVLGVLTECDQNITDKKHSLLVSFYVIQREYFCLLNKRNLRVLKFQS